MISNISLDIKGIIRGSIVDFLDSKIKASIIRSLLILIEEVILIKEVVLIESFF